MRNFLVVVLSFILYADLQAQDKLLLVEGTSPGLYISHTVAPKENYYSVGRLYNTSPKELAPYNNLSFEKGLTIGETIKIPLNENNFSQGDAAKDNEVLVPVYHVVQTKEGLYRISVNYNKVPVEALKKWNHIPGEGVSKGTKLIVGFLKVQKDQSPLASQAMNVPQTNVAIKPADEVKSNKTNSEIKTEKETAKRDEKPKAEDVQPQSAKEKTTGETTIPSSTKNTINFNGGKFKGLYTEQSKTRSIVNEAGVAAVFKTTSGWQDGKYYCFHNTATPGTIIKISNNATGKAIYAKVLDAIPDIKQNTGLLLRVSNSAADELGAGENKFDCSISYYK